MKSKWEILEALLLLGGATLLAPNCAARTAEACTLSPKMFDRRTTAEPLGEAQREIDHKYVEFMNAVAQSYEQRNAAAVNGCCDAAKEDIIGIQFCALVRYLLSDRKEPGPFLAAMPETYDQRKAFWFMELISAGGTQETPKSLPGIPLPDGLLFKFVDEIFGLMKKGNATAAERYLFLYDDADGEFGEYMDDQLPKLFLNYPRQVLALWPIFQKHRKRLEMLQSYMTEREKKQTTAKYEVLCTSGDNRCAEVRKFFAAH
jgi:hypothetical protein